MRLPKDYGMFCPNKTCESYGLFGQGNIIVISTYMTQSGRRRIFRCKLCGETFSETRGTIFYDLRTEEEKVLLTLKLLLKRMSITDIAEVLETNEDTIRNWLAKAAEHSEQVSQKLVHSLSVTQVEMDELWSFVRKKVARDETEAQTLGERWVWVSFAREFRLILACVVGNHSEAMARTLITKTLAVLTLVAGIPLFLSDGLAHYATVLLEQFHKVVSFPRTGKRGRPKKDRIVPDERLKYAQVVKQRKGMRVVAIVKRIVFGTAIKLKDISTSLLERQNLNFRQDNATLGRKTLAFAKTEAALLKQVTLYKNYHNLVRPHQALRQRVDEVVRGKVRRKWKPKTPCMAAGITNHVWSLRELMTYRVAAA